MALKLIGAVGLKVRPEAKDFRDEAERDIKRQMRGADRDGYKYPIKPEVDNEHMRRELNKSNKDLKDALEGMQKQVDKRKLDLRVNDGKFRQDVKRVQSTYAEMFRDMERRKKIFGDSKAFQMDTEDFEDDLREVKHNFDRLLKEMDGSEVEIHPSMDESSYRVTWAKLKWLTRDRFAAIHVRVKKSSLRIAQNALKALYGMSGARKGIDFIKDFGRYMRDLDKHIPALGMIGTLAVSAFGGVTALVGSVAHLANEFVRMGGAALALPGILGGFAVGIGAMVAVLKDFNREVPQIGKDLTDLQDKMSNNFWKQAKIPLMDAWNKVFPHFSKGIQETSTALGKWTAAFSEAFATHFDMSAFDKMFGNLNDSIGIASKGVGDFVKSLSILGQTGSEYLPKLAHWANDVNASFAGWLENAQATGQLNQMIDTGIQKLKEFGAIVRESGELIYILGKAAERAGFSGFGEMANGLERFNDKLNTLEGQRVLDDIFEGAAKISDGFKRALGAVGDFVWNSSSMLNELSGIVGDMTGDTFEKMFKAFERPKFQSGLTDFFQGISDGLGHITDQAPQIADVLGSVGSLAGTVAENMGKVVGKVIEVFGPEVSDALSDIAPDLESVGDSIVSMMDHLDNAGFGEFVGDMIRLAGSAMGDLAKDLDGISVAMEAVSKLGKGDFEGLKELNKEIRDMGEGKSHLEIAKEGESTPLENLPLVGGFFRWIDESIARLFDFIEGIEWGEITEALWGGLQDALSFDGLLVFDDWWPAVAKWWNEQIAEIVDIFNTSKDGVANAWNGFIGWMGGLFNFEGSFAFDDWFPGVVDWWNDQIQELVDMFNTSKDWIADIWNGFWDWLTSLFSPGDATTAPGGGGNDMSTSIFDSFNIEGWADTLGEKLETARGWINEKWEGFKSWLAGLFGGGEGDGSAMQVAIDFVMNAIDNASAVIGNVVNKAREWVANTWQGVLTALDNARTTIQNVKDKALNYARGKYQAALTAIDNARSTIQNVKNKALDYARGKYQAALTALDKAKGIISQVKNQALNYARGKYQGVLSALDKASSVVNAVQRKINSLKGKTVSLITKAKTIVSKVFSADGNYFPGVEKFANGGVRRGENHVAQIAPAGAMRVWAEPETGGEAYIPLSKAKRTRSEQILGQVADTFGMKLESYANGGTRGSSQSQSVAPSGDTYKIEMNNVPMDQSEEVASELMFNLKHLKRGGGELAFA